MTDTPKAPDLQAILDAATDGPWAAALEEGCHGVIGSIAEVEGSVFIAVATNDQETPEREPMRFANAKLMAMAPDLAKRVLELEAALREADATLNHFDLDPWEAAEGCNMIMRRALKGGAL